MTALVDRFICRREGHIPTFTITSASGVFEVGFVCPCRRCGKVLGFTLEECRAAVRVSEEPPKP